jgi:hypothetical protein
MIRSMPTVCTLRMGPGVFTGSKLVEPGVRELTFADGGLGADQIELVAGAVDQHGPGAGVGGIAGLGVVEDLGDHLVRLGDHRTTQLSRSRAARASAMVGRAAARARGRLGGRLAKLSPEQVRLARAG